MLKFPASSENDTMKNGPPTQTWTGRKRLMSA